MKAMCSFVILVLVASLRGIAAAPVATKCGPTISFVYDDAVWEMKRPADAESGKKSYELALALKRNHGEQVRFWSIRLAPEERAKMGAMTPEQLLAHMANMLSRRNSAPPIPKAERAGIVHYALVDSKGPGGNPFTVYIGAALKGDLLVYVMLMHEPHRSGGAPSDPNAMRERFLAVASTVTMI